MPGKVNEEIWDKAKEAGSHYKGKSKWKVTSAVYQRMGGKFHRKTEKGTDINMPKTYEDIKKNLSLTNDDLVRSTEQLEKMNDRLMETDELMEKGLKLKALKGAKRVYKTGKKVIEGLKKIGRAHV